MIPAEARVFRTRHEVLIRFPRCEIALQGEPTGAELLDATHDCSCVIIARAIADSDQCAGTGKQQGSCRTDSSRATSHQHAFSA